MKGVVVEYWFLVIERAKKWVLSNVRANTFPLKPVEDDRLFALNSSLIFVFVLAWKI